MDMDSKRLCFLCLIKLESAAYQNCVEYPFNDLHQYLTCDSKTWTFFKDERRRLKVTLCEGCAPVNEQFMKYHRQLRKVELKVKASLKIIYERITTSQSLPEISSPNGISTNEDLYSNLKVARNELLEKCSRTIELIQRRPQKIARNGMPKPSSFSSLEEHEDKVEVQVKVGEPKLNIKDHNTASVTGGEDKGTDLKQDDAVGAPASPGTLTSSQSAETRRPRCSLNPATGRQKCAMCLREFKNIPTFRSHYKTTHLKISYSCEFCSKAFRRQDSLTAHNRNVHSVPADNDRIKCEHCEKTFNRKWLLRKHQEKEHSMTKVGERPQPKKTQWKANCTFNQETMKYSCKLCSTVFKEERYFQDHYTSSHLNLKYDCLHPNCGKSFPHRSSLRRHQQNIHMGLKYDCKNCRKSFTLKAYLSLHLRTTKCGGDNDVESKAPPKPVCHLCGKSFTKLYGLQLHINTVHSQSREHQCELCGKEFKTRAHLKTHNKGVHSG